jgi:hypothetical protein
MANSDTLAYKTSLIYRCKKTYEHASLLNGVLFTAVKRLIVQQAIQTLRIGKSFGAGSESFGRKTFHRQSI